MSLYFSIFSASFLITFLFPEIATSIKIFIITNYNVWFVVWNGSVSLNLLIIIIIIIIKACYF
jgi:hypothetical protein